MTPIPDDAALAHIRDKFAAGRDVFGSLRAREEVLSLIDAIVEARRERDEARDSRNHLLGIVDVVNATVRRNQNIESTESAVRRVCVVLARAEAEAALLRQWIKDREVPGEDFADVAPLAAAAAAVIECAVKYAAAVSDKPLRLDLIRAVDALRKARGTT